MKNVIKCILVFNTMVSCLCGYEDFLNKQNYQIDFQLETFSMAESNRIVDLCLKDIKKITLNNNYKVSDISILRDFSENEYLLVEYNSKGYSIISLTSLNIIEVNPFGDYPLTDYLNYYIPGNGYYYSNNNQYYDSITSNKINNNVFVSLASSSDLINEKDKNEVNTANFNYVRNGINPQISENLVDGDNIYTNVEYFDGYDFIFGESEVDYSWYFKLNKTEYPKNDDSTCGYVAASLLLGYAEFFVDSGYFSDSEADKYINKASGHWTGINKDGKTISYFTEVPEIKDSFVKAVWPNAGPSIPWDIVDAINSFLDGKDGINFNVCSTLWLFGDVKQALNNGFPAAYFGSMNGTNHVVVLYGIYSLEEDRYLCHYGWDDNTQVVLNGLGFVTGGYVYIFSGDMHSHKGYFIDESTKIAYCGCGERV